MAATTRASSSAQDVHTAELYLAMAHIYPHSLRQSLPSEYQRFPGSAVGPISVKDVT
jgi:hypothetical protein